MQFSTLRFALGIVLSAALGAVMLGAPPPDLKTLFTHQAPIYLTTDRLSRLELPLEVITACRADLSDLRIFNSEGQEVPFLVETGLIPNVPAAIESSYTLEVVEVDRRRTDREGETPLHREVYELALPEEISTDLIWDLVFEARQRQYVRRIKVAARKPDVAEVVLIEGGSVFRLPSPVRENSRLPLPRFQGPLVPGERLIVTLEGEDGFYLDPVMRLTHARSLDPREKAAVELTEVSRREQDKNTVVELQRPDGVVADSIALSTTTASFHRLVEVWDEGPGSSDEALGSGRLFRVPAAATVENVDLQVKPARGDRFRVVIANGDSPPLEGLSFRAVIRRPALVFAFPSKGADEPSGLLRFGGGRAFRARYDVAHLRSMLVVPAQGRRAQMAVELHELPAARLGDVEPNPLFDPAPVLSFAMRAGAPVDSRLYSHRRRIEARPSAEGLTRLRLGLDDLAKAQPDLDDLRIIDAESRQWAYLLEKDAGRELRSLQVEGPKSVDGSSEYALILPAVPATVSQIVLHTEVAFFDRAYELRAVVEDRERAIARGRVAQRIGDPRPAKIGFPSERADSLKLVIEDGNDAPLEFERVEAEFPVPDLYFSAPRGSYSLLMGYPDDTAPQYELATVREIVLAVRSREAAAEELARNPDYSAAARSLTGSGAQQTLLWAALLVAVVFLGGLTLKLARREGKGG